MNVRGIEVPIEPDSVLTPDVYYGNQATGIYFETDDNHFGRISFENLDAIKVCRGEYLPYDYSYNDGGPFYWAYRIENSDWLSVRYSYEKDKYGTAYEFGGNVKEMLTDFSHFLFQFHDQFVEVIARGFWFEKSRTILLNQPLSEGHPFLDLPETNLEKFIAHTLTCQVRVNPLPIEHLVKNARYCSQKLFQFALELDGSASVNHTVVLFYRSGQLSCVLRGYFGRPVVEFDGIPTLEKVKPFIEKYMEEVLQRRKAMCK